MRRTRGRVSGCQSHRRQRSLSALVEGLESRVVSSTFNVSTETQLRSAITSADTNTSASNTINLTASITLTDGSAGELVVNNPTTTAKTLLIEGQKAQPSQTVLSGSASLNTGVLAVAGPARRA